MSTYDSADTRPDTTPASFRSSSPLARHLFYLLRDLPRIDRTYVYERCLERVAPERTAYFTDAQAAAVAAIRACRRDLGLWPSRREYERWRDAQTNASQLPSAGKLAYHFEGSLMKLIAAAGGEPVRDELSLRSLASGPRFEAADCVAALVAFREAMGPGPVTFAAYVLFAREAMRQDPSLRLPIGRATFSRCGTFVKLAQAAGLEAAWVNVSGRVSRPCRASEGAYTTDQIASALRFAAERVPGRLTVKAYKRVCEQLRDAGHLLPSATTVATHMGSWGEGLVAAGLLSEQALAGGAHRRDPAVVVADALARLREFLADQDTTGSRRNFDGWRRRRLAANPSVRIPSRSWFTGAFGSWPAAVAAATGGAYALDAGDSGLEAK